MEYVDNAYKLQIFTLRRTAHFPKRYQRRIGNDIEESASLIHACAVRAEENKDIFDEEQFSIRRMVDERVLETGDVYMSFQSWRAYAYEFNAHRAIRSIEKLINDLFPELGGELKWTKSKQLLRSPYPTETA